MNNTLLTICSIIILMCLFVFVRVIGKLTARRK